MKISYLLNTYYLNLLLPQLFEKNEYDFNACNNVRDILYNTDIINCIVKPTVDSPVGKPVQYRNLWGFAVVLFFGLISP